MTGMEIIGIIDYGSGNIHSATKAFENVAKDLKKEIKIKANQIIEALVN